MKRWIAMSLVTMLVLSLALGGCSGKGGSSGSGAEGKTPIKIGVITAVTGSQAAFGGAHKRGYEIALEEINAAGGVLGRPVELVTEDDGSKPQGAITAADKLVNQDKVPLIVGSYSSESTLALVKKLADAKVPLVAPTAVAANVTEQGSKYVFRICAPASVYAYDMLEFLQKYLPDAKTMALVYESTNFGKGTADGMKKAAEKASIQVVASEEYTAGSPDYKPLLTRLKQKNPDVIYFGSYLLDATLLMRQAKEVGLNPKAYTAAGTGFSSMEFISDQGAGKAAEYTLAVTQWMPDAKWNGSKEFDAKVFKKFNRHPQYHDMQAYAALKVAVEAIRLAGSTDREKIREALVKLDLKDTPFGPIKFDDKGQNDHPTLITQVQNGQYITVYPEDAARDKPILPTPAWDQRK
ncbi:MAG: ABC transporter substrate-binding protein [Firmicutes bacterium]|nr:ABC transporter substrate-binding protein [Bacillota bacterium]